MGAALLVAGLALLAHAPAVRNGFVFDDHAEIEDNRVLREPFSLRGLFSTEYWGAGSQTGWYRPVPLILQKLLFDRFGSDPLPYHALVLSLHLALAALLTWQIAARYQLPRGALVAGGLFAVHTVHSEVVSTAYGLKEVSAALFSFLALVVIAGWREDAPWGRLARLLGSGFLLGMAILSKESSAPVPAALVAADLLRGAPFARPLDALKRNGRAAALHGAFFVAAAFGAISMRYPVVGAILERTSFDTVTNPLVAMALPQRLAMGLKIAGLYARMLLWPVPFSVSYGLGAVAPPHGADPWPLFGALALGLLVTATLLCWRLRSPAGIGAVWAASAYLLASNLILPFSTMMSERFLYLPSLGLALLLAPSMERLLNPSAGRTAARRTILAAAIGTALAALVALTFVRAPIYGSDTALLAAGSRWYPGAVIARLAQSDALTADHRFEEAARDLLALKHDYPDLPRVDEHLAMNAESAGDDAGALGPWKAAIHHPLADVGTYEAYAEALLRSHEPEAAIAQLTAGLRRRSGLYRTRARAYRLRGVLLLERGRSVQGLADLKMAAAIDPDSPGILVDLAGVQDARGDTVEAERLLRRALSLDPHHAPALARLGRFLLAHGRGAEAIPYLETLASVDPADQRARSDLGTAWMHAGRYDRAQEIFQGMLTADPQNPVALATLGTIEEREGRREEALGLYRRYLAGGPPDNSLTAAVRARAERLER